MQRKYGLDMQLPAGKLPGFYAQIVKGIADRAPLFDRHKELLIFDRPAYFPAVQELLDHYKVKSEPCDLLMVPAEGVSRCERFDDFAIVTREGRIYFDLAYTACFRLTGERPEAEAAPALMQLEEFLLAKFPHNGHTWSVIERQLSELAERVAQAYRCGIEWLDTDAL